MNTSNPDATPLLSERLAGSWGLLTRIDTTADGRERDEPQLGREPIALLYYDGHGYFAAQFMRRERSSAAVFEPPTAGANNSRAVDGYDAYFGSYVVDEAAGTVTQVILGALARELVGMVLVRHMQVDGDRLVVRVDTTAPDGGPLTRTLTWKRLASGPPSRHAAGAAADA